MAKPKRESRFYSQDEKNTAMELAVSVGSREAARRLGIPPGTLSMWMTRAGVRPSQLASEDTAEDSAPASVEDLIAQAAESVGQRLIDAASSTSSYERTRAEAAARLERTRLATEHHRAHAAEEREEIRALALSQAKTLLLRMDEEYVDFKGKDGDRVTYPQAPSNAVRDFAVTFAVLMDKYRLEVGEATGRTESVTTMRASVARIAKSYGLEEAEVFAEVERIMAEEPAGLLGDGKPLPGDE